MQMTPPAIHHPAFKHPFQRLRYAAVKALLIEELALTHRQAEAVLAGGAIPSHIPSGTKQRRWLVKDVLDYVAAGREGRVSLGKGVTDGGTNVLT
jgi:hypothetical protein